MINSFYMKSEIREPVWIDEFFYEYQLIDKRISCDPTMKSLIDVPLQSILVI